MSLIASWVARSARRIPRRKHTMVTQAFMKAAGITIMSTDGIDHLSRGIARIKSPTKAFEGLMECFANTESPMDWR